MQDEWQVYDEVNQAGLVQAALSWEECGVPGVLAETNPPGLARNHPPILVEFWLGALLVCIRQYSLPREVIQGLQPLIEQLK